jgi:peptidoglycan biosynthesis protein MviN/MurJ (putative lipid II flippase)
MAGEPSKTPFPRSASPMAEPPIRMRVYGLLNLTRKGYLILQGLVGSVLAAGILWWVLAGMGRRWPEVGALVNLHWILASLLIFEAFETYFILCAFHQKRRIAERGRR